MISIVIPAFNAEATVPSLIEDFLGQTYGDIEVICVDDGSDDNTFACAEGIARRNAAVRAISIKHGGPAIARGTGADVACGEWVIFADADDRVEPTWLESLVVGARQVDPRGEADIVAGASCWNRSLVRPGWRGPGDDDPWSDYRGVFHAGKQMDEVWDRMLDLPESTASISHSMCDKLFRTELARRAMRGVDRSVRIGEDTCFNIVAFCHARAVALTYARGYRWTQTFGSLSHSSDGCALQDYRSVYSRAMRELIMHGYGGRAAELWRRWMRYFVSRRLWNCLDDERAVHRLADRFMATYEAAV